LFHDQSRYEYAIRAQQINGTDLLKMPISACFKTLGIKTAKHKTVFKKFFEQARAESVKK